MTGADDLTRHDTSGGARVYTLSVPAFPHFRANVFLVVLGAPQHPSYAALVDAGGHHAGSTAALEPLMERVRAEFGEAVSWPALSRVVVTHPHPDHAGGLPFVRTLTGAPLAAFHAAVPAIEYPEERRDRALAGVDAYIRWTGATGEYAERLRRRAGNLMQPSGMPVQTPLQDGDVLDGLFTVIHTPGHEGSQICLRLHDLLLSADHLLPRNSPPLMPERAQPGAGLRHYLSSLDRIEALEVVSLALGGHDGPMSRWRERVQFLRARYADKLRDVLAACTASQSDGPQTVQELLHLLYPRLNPPQALLLLDQTAALVEALVEHGELLEEAGPGGAVRFSAGLI